MNSDAKACTDESHKSRGLRDAKSEQRGSSRVTSRPGSVQLDVLADECDTDTDADADGDEMLINELSVEIAVRV